MLEVKYVDYDEQDSYFYVPRKPKDYYLSKGTYESNSQRSDSNSSRSKNNTYSSQLSDFLGVFSSSNQKKK